MYLHEGLLLRDEDGKYRAVILRLNHDEPTCEMVKEYTTERMEEASIWLDDELERLTCGKGLWDE